MTRSIASTALTLFASLAIASPALAQDSEIPFEFGAPAHVTPSFGLAFGFGQHEGADGRTHDVSGLSLHAGVKLYPSLTPIAPYLDLGIEAEWTQLFDGRDATYIMPTAKLGLAWLGCYEDDGVLDPDATILPCANTYLLTAIRPPAFERDASLRLGVGFNSLFVSLFGLSGGVILPSGLEFYVEVEPDGSAASFARIQLSF